MHKKVSIFSFFCLNPYTEKRREEKMEEEGRFVLKRCSRALNDNNNNKKKKKDKRRLKVSYLSHFKFVRFEKKKINKLEQVKKKMERKRKTTSIHRKKKTITCALITPFIEEEGKNKHDQVFIYFCAESRGYKDPLKWYRINPNKNTKGTQLILSPICSMPSPYTSIIPYQSSFVGLDSKLYLVGGFFESQNQDTGLVIHDNSTAKAYVCDINSDPDNWKECCPMNSPRKSPTLAVVDGLIYAFGSTKHHPFAEVFDPTLNEWTALPSPLTDSKKTPELDNNLFLKDQDEMMMVLSTEYNKNTCSTYSFNVKSRSWTLFPNPIPRVTRNGNTTNSVVVGNVVFTFQCGQLCACDISQAKPIEEPVYGLRKAIRSVSENDLSNIMWQLYYIGKGKLCLMWDSQSDDSDDMLIITCVKFWVGKYDGKGSWNALIDRTDYYLAEGVDVTSCLAM